MAISKIEISKEFEEIQPRPKKRRWLLILIIIIIILLAFAVYHFVVIPLGIFPQLHSTYQAVFLTNGQVYFGKLYNEESGYPTLRNVFYLQVTQPLQSGTETPASNINLVKLGGELHGPTDEMKINRSQILFIEDLKSDSRVVQAIQQFKPAQ